MAHGISWAQTTVCCMPVIGPIMSFVYAEEANKNSFNTLLCKIPQSNMDFNAFRAEMHRASEDAGREHAVLRQQQITYHKYGLASSLATLAAASDGHAGHIWMSSF